MLPGKERDRDRRDDKKEAEEDWRRGAKENTKRLSDRQYDEFADLLRSITVSRATIRDAMVYCLDHAEYSNDIVKCIKEALTLKETPALTKVMEPRVSECPSCIWLSGGTIVPRLRYPPQFLC